MNGGEERRSGVEDGNGGGTAAERGRRAWEWALLWPLNVFLFVLQTGDFAAEGPGGVLLSAEKLLIWGKIRFQQSGFGWVFGFGRWLGLCWASGWWDGAGEFLPADGDLFRWPCQLRMQDSCLTAVSWGRENNLKNRPAGEALPYFRHNWGALCTGRQRNRALPAPKGLAL